VSVGRTQTAAASEPAAKHWFAPFSSTTPTIEWRHPKGGAPVAIIQRWHLADNNDLDRDGRRAPGRCWSSPGCHPGRSATSPISTRAPMPMPIFSRGTPPIPHADSIAARMRSGSRARAAVRSILLCHANHFQASALRFCLAKAASRRAWRVAVRLHPPRGVP